MRINCRIVASVLFLAVQFNVGHAFGGSITPDLADRINAAAPGEQFRVIVKLADKVNVSHLAGITEGLPRKTRTETVVSTLREKSEKSQMLIRNAIAERERAGKSSHVKPLWIFNGLALIGSAETIRELADRDDVELVMPDRIVRRAAVSKAVPSAVPTGRWNLDRIAAPDMWAKGFRGQGVVVASLDTGVDVNHPDLASRWRGKGSIKPILTNWYDPNGQHPSGPVDVDGHGTGTMGIMVGGSASGMPIGVAPDARWISAKIFDDQNNASLSGIHLAFQWALAPNNDPAEAPDVVNCSWDLLSQTGGTAYDPEFRRDVQKLTAAGIAVVFAGGNQGPSSNTSASPGNYPESIAVGYTTNTDSIGLDSSRGPTAAPPSVFKVYDSIYPTLTAPGANVFTATNGGAYATVTGSSFSAPHVSGAIALLLNKSAPAGAFRPTAAQILDALQKGSVDLGVTGPDNDYGYGRVDVYQAGLKLGLIPTQIPDGDVNGDGRVTVADALLVLRAAVGASQITPQIMIHGDASPFDQALRKPSPDQIINIGDALILLQKAVGLVQW